MSNMNTLIEWLDIHLGQKAPRLPVSVKEFLVKIAPYAAIISVIFVGLGLLSVLVGGSLAFGLLSGIGAARYAGDLGFSVIFLIVGAVLQIMAIPGLFRRTPNGWTFAF